jgi:hypothetical protein
MTCGIAFWRKDEDSPTFHLRFVITDPDVDGMVLVVGMSTVRGTGREDLSCVLQPGDHPSVDHPSLVRYDRAIEISFMKLIQEKLRGEITLVDNLPPNVTRRIQEGARKSTALRQKFRKYFPLFSPP